MIVEIYFLILSIFYFIIAGIEDIKKYETYDFWNFSALFLTISSVLIYILIFENFQIINLIFYSTFLGVFFGTILFYMGFWGGGDSKFLLSFSVIFYFLISFFNKQISFQTNFYFNYISNSMSFLFNYISIFFIILNILLIIFILIKFRKTKLNSFIVSLYFLILLLGFTNFFFSIFFCFLTILIYLITDKYLSLNKKYDKYFTNIILFELVFLMLITTFKNVEFLNLFLFFTQYLYSTLIGAALFLIPYIFYLYFKNGKTIFNIFEKIGFFVILIYLFYSYTFLKINFVLIGILGLLYYLLKITKFVEKFFFLKNIELKNIVCGDWISQNIKKGKKTIFKKEDFKLGINDKDLKKLKKLFSPNKKFLVKTGIAYIPILFLGFIIFFIKNLN
jgi:hypothetical protein